MVMKKKNPKPRKKVVIKYPPVPTKKWVPPDKRPKKVRKPAYVKPEGVTQKLKISSLNKVWHKFRVYDNMAIISGHFSQSHKRFRPKTKGFQGPCNCYVAIALAKIYKMEQWDENMVDTVLDVGDQLYLRTLQHLKDKCKVEISITEVHNSFYFEKSRIQMELGKVISGFLHPGIKEDGDLIKTLEKFFKDQTSGILESQKKHFAVWKADGSYYLLDASERDVDGKRWTGIIDQGFACVFKVHSVLSLAKWIFEHLDTKINSPFELYPCRIARISDIRVNPPSHLLDIVKKPSIISVAPVIIKDLKKKEPQKETPPPPIVGKKPSDAPVEFPEDKNAEAKEFSPDIEVPPSPSRTPSWMKGTEVIKPATLEDKKPLEELKTESISYFRDITPKTSAILRATRHQCKRRYGKEAGKQSLSNAIMALTMLRLHKTKTWIPKILDEIIEAGNKLHLEVVKTLKPTEELCLERIPNKITLRERIFTPDIKEYALIGRLQSAEDNVLDLLPALEQFLRDNDATIIKGPLSLAIWVENGLYYMFDPNARDATGKVVLKKMKIASGKKTLDYKPGAACVTWYRNLNDLVKMYFANIDKLQKRDQFVLSRVVINDFIEVPDAWYKFQGVANAKWILRGTFGQNDKRFSGKTRDKQGTACASMALAYSTVKPEKEWNTDTLDEILLSGDKLYNDAVQELKRKDKFKQDKLMITEVPRKFAFDATKEVNLEIQDCLINGIVSAKSNDKICNLKKGLEEFFIDSDTGVITAKSLSMAVWKKDELYYYYDSHSRDEKGIATDFGAACVMRLSNIPDLATSVETNLPPHPEDTFNINRVAVKVWEITDDGLARPPLNNYTAIDTRSSILRSNYYNGSDIFKLNKGKQSVPMCLVAVAMAKLYPAAIWSNDILDQILHVGDELYVTSMAELLKQADEEVVEREQVKAAEVVTEVVKKVISATAIVEADDAKSEVIKDETKQQPETVVEKEPPEEITVTPDAITSTNVIEDFLIGVNKFHTEIEAEKIEGNFEENLKECLEKHFLNITPTTEGQQNNDDETKPKPLLLESNTLTLVLWKDDQLYYLFDPNSRDSRGEIFGKDVWSVKPPEPKIESENEEESEEEDEEDEGSDVVGTEVGGGDAPEVGSQTSQTEVDEQDEEEKKAAAQAALEAEAEKIKKEEEDKKRKIKEAEEASKTEGRACVMWFTDFNRLVEHIVENTPPTKRHRMLFNLTPFEVNNALAVKRIFNPEVSVRTDFYEGNWYNFQEIDTGRWILRGKMDQTNELFPESNRGKQTIPNCYTALAFAFLFSPSQFKPETVDSILKYGDRLYTFTKKQRLKALKEQQKGLGLSDSEVQEITDKDTYDFKDFPRKFCTGEAKVDFGITPEFLKGNLYAKDLENPIDVKKALEKYFSEYKYGIMCAKGNCVAIWRGQKVYYMFDPKSRGPNGVRSPFGKACITRYLDLQTMADVFVKNIPQEGGNEFYIHKTWLKTVPCSRERQPEPEEEKEIPKTKCFKQVIPGKCVLRATINQNDNKFKREGENVLCAPIAVVALATTLIHKVQNWSTPLLDEIIEVGNELYEATMDELGFDFNPWEQGLTVNMVKNDFKLGVFKTSCELRHADQKGIIDIKASQTQNLRQGIEKFFEENTHGVLQTDTLTAAIWEDADDCLIYMFDPNPRGMYGMPNHEGVACVMTFVNAKVAADHIMSVIQDPTLLEREFVITPVEIIVGNLRTKRKQPKKPKMLTSSLPRCADLIPSASKRKRRELAEQKRKKKEEERKQVFARFDYEEMGDGSWILRGMRSQASEYYPESTRNYQDLTNAIAAYVMHYLLPINSWFHEHIDLVLNVGNQLYIDSYVVCCPRDRMLGLRDVLRSFWINNVFVNIVIFKPVIEQPFLHTNVVVALTNLFQQRNICLFGACNKWMMVVFKMGYYFLFDPRDKDIDGKKMEEGKGSASVIRYDTISDLTSGLLYTSLDDAKDEIGNFLVVLLTVEKVEPRIEEADVEQERGGERGVVKKCCCNLCCNTLRERKHKK